MITDAVRDEVLNVAVDLAVTQLLIAVPYLGPFFQLPIVKQILEALIKMIVKPVVVGMQTFINFTEIDIQDGAKKAEADKAKDDLGKVLNDEKATQDQIDAARAAFRAKYGALIHGLPAGAAKR